MKATYKHTNLIAKDWRQLAAFYKDVFGCKDVPPQRKQEGDWLEKGTNTPGAKLEGMHLLLPGQPEGGITLEVFQYSEVKDKLEPLSNRSGYGHIAFEVEKVEIAVDKVVASGGKKFGEVVTKEIPGAGEISFAYVLDPEDNIIELQSWA